MPWDRSVFIAQLNIEYLRAQLLTVTDQERRRQIEILLAEEEAKLASLLDEGENDTKSKQS
ncbi:MAG: hypothetical protein WA973_18170 [Mesorhizobium sp.]